MKQADRSKQSRLVGLAAAVSLAACGGDGGNPDSEPDAGSVQGTGNHVGVVYCVHGGMESYEDQYLWDNAIQMFAHDRNHPVARFVIWEPDNWSMVLADPSVEHMLIKYSLEYERMGGVDPFTDLTLQQADQLAAALTDMEEELGVEFSFEKTGWIALGDDVSSYSHPRMIYQSADDADVQVDYCGEDEPTGAWRGCDPERYNVDGPYERLLAAGVDRIMLVDLTVGGVRFSKTFDVYRAGLRLVESWNAEHESSVELTWVNDPTDLLIRSYPSAPEDWTRSLGVPEEDRAVALVDSPNPVSENRLIADAHADAIAAAFNPDVPAEETGVVLVNHALFNNNEAFDPKVDDTILLDAAIEGELSADYPGISGENVLGAFMGVEQVNPEHGRAELTREMRGEGLGHFYLYESDKQHPTGQWGYFYWDALAELKDRGVKHIVVAFPQVATDSALTIIEVPNQIGKEIGTQTYLPNPVLEGWLASGAEMFTDHWGVWADTECGEVPCCFEMGGCDDGRPYPPPRQTHPSQPMSIMDPSLAFDVSEYGHLGYDSALGPPDPAAPVQDQYTGTWSMANGTNADPRLAQAMAEAIAEVLTGQ